MNFLAKLASAKQDATRVPGRTTFPTQLEAKKGKPKSFFELSPFEQVAMDLSTGVQQTNTLPSQPDPKMMSRDAYTESIPWYERLIGDLTGQSAGLTNDDMLRVEGPSGEFHTGRMARAEIPLVPGDIQGLQRAVTALGKTLPRTDPRLIAGKKWFHGSATEGLTPKKLSGSSGGPTNLFGEGVYLTDSSYEIPKGYAKSRSNKWTDTPWEKSAPTKRPIIYEGRVQPKKVLDLEEPAPQEIRKIFQEKITPRYADEAQTMGPYVDVEPGGNLEKTLNKTGVTTEDLIGAMREDLWYAMGDSRDASSFGEVMSSVTYRIREQGYDAMTHTGGLRTGNGKHQVLILLDPSNELGFGGGEVKSFMETRQPTKNTPRDWPMFKDR